jgi:hypothetical protein
MKGIKSRVSAPCILLTLALLALLPSHRGLGAVKELDVLAFFRVHQDKDKYMKVPSLYEALPLRDTTDREFYVERRAAHMVSNRAVEAVIVKKTPKYRNISEFKKKITEDLAGSNPNKGTITNDSTDYYYRLTLRIEREEGKRLVSFNDANLNQSFNVKLFGQSIGVLDFVYQYESDTSKYVEFSIHLLEKDTYKNKDLLSQFSGKIIWE